MTDQRRAAWDSREDTGYGWVCNSCLPARPARLWDEAVTINELRPEYPGLGCCGLNTKSWIIIGVIGRRPPGRSRTLQHTPTPSSAKLDKCVKNCLLQKFRKYFKIFQFVSCFHCNIPSSPPDRRCCHQDSYTASVWKSAQNEIYHHETNCKHHSIRGSSIFSQDNRGGEDESDPRPKIWFTYLWKYRIFLCEL